VKTETQIKATRENLKNDIIQAEKLGNDKGVRIYKEVCKVCIYLIDAILEEKQPPFYWCVGCRSSHNSVECPLCHKSNDLNWEDNDKVYS